MTEARGERKERKGYPLLPGLKSAKMSSRWTWEELGQQSGISPATLRKWSELRNGPPMSAIEKLAQALGVTVEQLRGEKK